MDEQTVIIQENYERYEMIYLSAFAKTECQHYAQRDILMLTLHLAFLVTTGREVISVLSWFP